MLITFNTASSFSYVLLKFWFNTVAYLKLSPLFTLKYREGSGGLQSHSAIILPFTVVFYLDTNQKLTEYTNKCSRPLTDGKVR
jgi:hypothetical protein